MGNLFKNGEEKAYIFSALETEAYVKSYLVESGEGTVTPLFSTGKHVKAVPEQWANGFGFQYYERQHVYCHPCLPKARQPRSAFSCRSSDALY